MAEIVPTVLTDDANQFAQLLSTYPTFARRIQIDVADGTFVATNTIQIAYVTALPEGTTWDLHMMVVRPSEQLDQVLRLKPSLVVFHAEATEDLLPIFAKLKEAGIKTGVALLQRTYPGDVEAYIKAVDHVLVFAGQLGKQGGTADLLQTEKVKLIKALNPAAEIGWDGGINLDNVRAVAHAQVDIINVGSFISMNPDPAEAFKQLQEEAEQRGVKV